MKISKSTLQSKWNVSAYEWLELRNYMYRYIEKRFIFSLLYLTNFSNISFNSYLKYICIDFDHCTFSKYITHPSTNPFRSSRGKNLKKKLKNVFLPLASPPRREGMVLGGLAPVSAVSGLSNGAVYGAESCKKFIILIVFL